MGSEGLRYEKAWEALSGARDEFYLRYYKWAGREIEREIDQDFRLLRMVKGDLAMSFLVVLEGLSRDKQRSLLLARLKDGFGSHLGKELVSAEEKLLANELKSRLRAYMDDVVLHGYPQGSPKIPRTRFRKLLREKLVDQGLGEFDRWDLPAEWRYRLPIGPWTVETYVDTGGRSRQLAYGHVIKGSEDVPLLEPSLRLSCMGWLGLATTDWNRLTPEDLPQAADDLILLCRHFLDAVPELMRGLEPPKVG